MYTHNYRATGYPFRLYGGKDALDKLPDEVARNRAQLPQVIEHSLRNFNADSKREFARERELLATVLEAAL